MMITQLLRPVEVLCSFVILTMTFYILCNGTLPYMDQPWSSRCLKNVKSNVHLFVKNLSFKTMYKQLVNIEIAYTWWRHQMETFSALLAICVGNSPVPGEFPAQRPVTRSFDVFFDLRLSKRLSKQWWGWWFETLSHQLWRHHDDILCQPKQNIGETERDYCKILPSWNIHVGLDIWDTWRV